MVGGGGGGGGVECERTLQKREPLSTGSNKRKVYYFNNIPVKMYACWLVIVLLCAIFL